MGDLYEDVAQAVIYAVDPTVVCKHNDYIMIESRGGKHYKRTQVDIHAYKDGEPGVHRGGQDLHRLVHAGPCLLRV